LLLTGSPVIHTLGANGRERMDYIKLPCLTRTDRGVYRARYLDTGVEELSRLRADLILAATRHFAPDLLMVDKKPLGVRGELEPALRYLRTERPRARTMLVLRDILDRPEAIISNWSRHGHDKSLRQDYDRILILGQQEIFDPVVEYRFPEEAAARTRFCGFLRKDTGAGSVGRATQLRESLGLDVKGGQQIMLVTPGGGEDGFKVIETSLLALAHRPQPQLQTIVVGGPEMPADQREQLRRLAATIPNTRFLDFSNDLLGLMAAADLVVSMGGYNTICEIVSLRRRAIVIPRVRPTEEQLIRMERLAPLNCFLALHPDRLTVEQMAEAIERQLTATIDEATWARLDLGAQAVINAEVEALLKHEK
ncbi:MAG: glycosyltransferase family protein, partial [Acidobacteriota bacterium]